MFETKNQKWDETGYLYYNPDVKEAVLSGLLKSGLEHWEKYGKPEGRPGVFYQRGSFLSSLDFQRKDKQYTPANSSIKKMPEVSVSVIVVCHNYGEYLEQSLESVLGQTVSPKEILLVDDNSQDNTPEIAEKYKDRISYVRGTFGSAAKSKRVGVELSCPDCEYVLLVDADNYIPANFLETALSQFTSPRVGVSYCDIQEFGLSNTRITMPEEYRSGELSVRNFVDNCSVVRRCIFDVIDKDAWIDNKYQADDYKLFQIIAEDGWEFRKHTTPLFFRVHDRNYSIELRDNCEKYGYSETHGLAWQKVTLFIPMSGRYFAWEKQKEFLANQTFPKDRIVLIFCDTSQDPTFKKILRLWMAESDYPDIHYLEFKPSRKGLAEELRHNKEDVDREVHITCCKIWNKLRSLVNTEWTWILEDDIIPPLDVLSKLISRTTPEVGSVCAPYYSRFGHDTEALVWLSDDITIRAKPPKDTDLSFVRGSGFGCLLIRTMILKDWVFRIPYPEKFYDPTFFKLGMPDKWIRLCDWSCLCEHLSDPRKAHHLDHIVK